MGSDNEGDDSIAIWIDCFDWKEKIFACTALEIEGGDSNAGRTVEGFD